MQIDQKSWYFLHLKSSGLSHGICVMEKDMQALTNRIHAYMTYSKSQILQTAVLDYFLASTFMYTPFQFPEYVEQS